MGIYPIKKRKKMDSEFLLIEYQRLQQLHFTEKKDEEQRVNFFIAVASGAIAGIILLFQSNKFATRYIILIAEVVLLLLITIGINTLGRVAMATVQSKEIMRLRNKIQEIFAKNDTGITDYINAQIENISASSNKSSNSFLQNTTTLRFLVITINTFLIGGFICVPFIYLGKNLYCDNLLTATLIISLTILLIWIMLTKYYEILKNKSRPWNSS